MVDLIKFLSLFLACSMTSCVWIKSMPQNPMQTHKENFFWTQDPLVSEIKAVVVVVHGLNLKPKRMEDWAQVLTKNGALVLKVNLKGHHDSLDEMKHIGSQDWIIEFSKAADEAKKRAHELGLPLYFLGFSLGALMGVSWQENLSEDENGFEKMVLLAPALAMPWYASGLKFFSLFGKDFILPSRSPKGYRAQKGTSVSAYEAALNIMTNLEKSGYKKVNIPTLVLMDKGDELIPLDKVKDVTRKFKLDQWHLEIVANDFAGENYGFRHLLVDVESVGPKLWQNMTDKVLRHFSLK